MPYREKIGWLYLVAVGVAFIPYFAFTTATAQSTPMPNLHQLSLFALAVTVQVAIIAIGHAVFYFGAPRDAKVRPDERDLAIERRSMSAAYYVLIAGTIMVGCILPFTSTGWKIVNGAIFTIVAAEIVHYAVVVFSYRGRHDRRNDLQSYSRPALSSQRDVPSRMNEVFQWEVR